MFIKILDRYDRQIHRFLEIIPAFLTWSLLLSPIWLGLIAPQLVIYLLTLLCVYWVYLALKHTIGITIGYFRYKHELGIDWAAECKKLNFAELPDKVTLPATLSDVKHFLLIPLCSEPYEALKNTIDAIFNQTFPLKQITLIFTLEERVEAHKEILENIHEIIGDRANLLGNLLIYIHPQGIVGEAIGAGAANRTWGARHAVADLTSHGENLRNYIFSTIDGDHIMHPQYLARLTHLYLTSDKRDNKFYSTAVSLFDNNYWKVPTVMRIEATNVILGGLSDWIVADKNFKDIFSAYATSLKTLIDADYWDVTLGIDDTVLYWRAFLARDGDFMGVSHFIPYSADAVEGANYMESYRNLYRQLLRWGWGVIVFPLSIKAFLKNNRIPLSRKISWTLRQLKMKVVLVSIVFLITFGFNILTLVNNNIKQTSFAYVLPNVMSMILTSSLVLLIPNTILRFKLVAPMPSNWSLWRKTLAVCEGPLIIFNLLTYSFVPWIDAQTRMMLGKKMKDLYHTPKMR